jgi:hypothetical protein
MKATDTNNGKSGLPVAAAAGIGKNATMKNSSTSPSNYKYHTDDRDVIVDHSRLGRDLQGDYQFYVMPRNSRKTRWFNSRREAIEAAQIIASQSFGEVLVRC